jgi:teichoic acid transport system permease protein
MSATTPDGLVRLGGIPPLPAYLRSIWSRRELALSMPLGELRAQNMDTVLGGAWHLLNPLLLVGVYYVVFGLILDVGSRGTDNFIAFLSCGIFTFFYTRKSIQSGARTIVANVGLIRSIKFPRAILPISAVIGETAALAPAVAALVLIALLSGERPHLTWLLLLPIFALQAVLNLGAAFFIARLADHFHDVQQLIPYVMTIWMYLSGIFYEVDAFVRDDRARLLFRLNPIYAYATLVRDAVLHGTTQPDLWVVAASWALVAVTAGFFWFRRREQAYGRA